MQNKKTFITLASFFITVLAGVYVFAFNSPGQPPPPGGGYAGEALSISGSDLELGGSYNFEIKGGNLIFSGGNRTITAPEPNSISLNPEGDLNLGTGASNNIFIGRTGAGVPVSIRAGSADTLYVTGGKVGVRDTNPSALFSIKNDPTTPVADIFEIINSAGNKAFSIDNGTLNAKFWRGGASVPGISSISDTNTGFFWGSGDTNELFITTDGVERIKINSDGIRFSQSGDTMTNVAAPINNSDVATKAYVDGLVGGGSTSDEVLGSITANSGLYSNLIPNLSLSVAYTEVCFPVGAAQPLYDVHSAGGSTAGGSCAPGAIGFIIEKNRRTSAVWENAKQTCLLNGMRLPEPFEYKLACKNVVSGGNTWQINNISSSGAEWASNFVSQSGGSINAVTMGDNTSQCYKSGSGQVGGGGEDPFPFRCVR